MTLSGCSNPGLFNNNNLKQECINHIIMEILEYLTQYATPLTSFIEAHEAKTISTQLQ